MATRKYSDQEISKMLLEMLPTADNLRAQRLAKIKELQARRESAWAQEIKRAAIVHGAGAAKVKAMEARLEGVRKAQRYVAVELKRAAVEGPIRKKKDK